MWFLLFTTILIVVAASDLVPSGYGFGFYLTVFGGIYGFLWLTRWIIRIVKVRAASRKAAPLVNEYVRLYGQPEASNNQAKETGASDAEVLGAIKDILGPGAAIATVGVVAAGALLSEGVRRLRMSPEQRAFEKRVTQALQKVNHAKADYFNCMLWLAVVTVIICIILSLPHCPSST